jgi:Cytochrome P460
MKRRSLARFAPCWLALAAVVGYAEAPAPGGKPMGAKEWATASDELKLTAQGELQFPQDYREWVFLSSGIDMSYSDRGDMGHSMFDNVFVQPEAYREFVRTGTWADGTALVLEVRGATGKGSINKQGKFQNGDLMGLEVHVKDTKRFPGGWAFFNFRGKEPAQMIPMSQDCYACHRDHGAVDTTFVQFYPTLLEIAAAKGTLTPGREP